MCSTSDVESQTKRFWNRMVSKKYMTNNDIIDRDIKRREDHSHKECSTYVNSPNATLLERPLTFDKRQTTKTKDSLNSRAWVSK